MPIPKRTASPKKIVKKTTPTYNDGYYNNTPSYNNKEKKSSGCWRYLLIIFGIYIVGVIINAVINENSSNGSSRSSNTTSTSITTNSYEKDGKCKGSDGYRYTKPAHAYCDGGKTPLGWKCNAGYYSKSENNKTRINSSWYCAANCKNFSCVGYSYIPCTSEKAAIPTYVNEYSQSSIDNYNAKIEAYNRCLSEKCSCA